MGVGVFEPVVCGDCRYMGGVEGLVAGERWRERRRADVPLEGRAGERGVDRRDDGRGSWCRDAVDDGNDWYGRPDEHVAWGDEDGGRHEAGNPVGALGDVVGHGWESERPVNAVC